MPHLGGIRVVMALYVSGALGLACQRGPVVSVGATGEFRTSGTTSSSRGVPTTNSTSGGSRSGSSGASSTGGSSAGSSAGTSTGRTALPDSGVTCGPGRVWFGDACLAGDCSQAPLGSYCPLADGGTGFCVGATCAQYPYGPSPSCGIPGVTCPTDDVCVYHGSPIAQCIPDCVWNESCFDAGICGTCLDGGTCVEGLGCVTSTCGDNTENMACLLDAGPVPTSFPIMLAWVGACCGGRCADLRRDHDHCGSCGIQCNPDQVCSDAEPFPVGGSILSEGELLDSNLAFVQEHSACISPSTCTADTNGDACALASGGAPGICCLGTCVDPAVDSLNCGSCSWQCGMGQDCAQGLCVGGDAGACPAGTTFSYFDKVCQPSTCGPSSLGTACCLPYPQFPNLPLGCFVEPMECCATGCIDVSEDPANCGQCGNVCRPGETCTTGGCWPIADCALPQPYAGEGLCEADGGLGQCCNGSCVGELDNLNCGPCGYGCPEGTFCALGSVFGYACAYDAGASPVFVGCGDAGCPAGTVCTNEYDTLWCVPAACSPVALGDQCAYDAGDSFVAGVCCGSSCVQNDHDLSGGCGVCGITCLDGGCDPVTNPCPAGDYCAPAYPGLAPVCQIASCGAASEGQYCAFGYTQWLGDYYLSSRVCCGDQCVDLYQDPTNCGTCGHVCPSGICAGEQCFDPSPGESCLQTCGPLTVCSAGQCVDSTCLTPFYGPGDWDPCAAADGAVGQCCGLGVCANIAEDPNNCGLCGIACPPGQTCKGGTCSGSPECGPGHIGEWCDRDAGPFFACCPGFGCTDTWSDPSNCGICGTRCGALGTCRNGICI